jgi:diguanylate cyclase (GGDEF)-like protein
MSLVSNAVICVHLVIVMLVMLGYSIRRMDRKNPADKLYVTLLIVNIALLIMDVLARCDGTSHEAFPLINRVSNFLIFAANPVLPSLWLLYVLHWANKGVREIKKALRWIALLNAVNLAMVIASQYTGWYYSIGAGNIYARGPLYSVSTALMIVPAVASYGVILWSRNRLEPKLIQPLLMFPVPPLVGIVLQLFFFGVPFALNAIVVSLLILLLYVQDRNIHSDVLTGVGNRRQMYAVISEKIRRSSPGRTFSLIMLDLDNFKAVNDSYGHEAGDRMLVGTAEMLKASVRSKDYVIRYGGDEFLLVADITEQEHLNTLLERIDARRRKLNESSKLPLKLSFSVGSIIYKYGEMASVDELIKQVDRRMYENKRRKCVQQPDESAAG